MIVDDNQNNIKALGTILFNEGFRLVIANSGQECLDKVELAKPDIILLDIMMPEMDGFQVAEKLKKNKSTEEIPIIFLTAKIEDDDVVHGFELGAVDYIKKPFRRKELLVRVANHIELTVSKKKLKEINEQRKILLQILSHDLMNPLNFIDGTLQLSEEDPNIISLWKDDLQLSVSQIKEIIDTVRKLQALEDSKFDVQCEYYDLKELISKSLRIIRPLLERKKITIVDEIENVNVFVDEGIFINSVMNNILTNAIKFSEQKSNIIIKTKKEKSNIILSVIDTGIGIPDTILENIFRLDVKTSRKGTEGEIGTGYGLPLVKKFVEAFGGSINIESIVKTDNNMDHGTEIQIVMLSDENK